MKQRRTDLASLKRQIRGDLEWITLRAIEKDPLRRYASASEFAADIQRHLADEPVLAGPPTIVYRLGKFARKNRRLVTAASAIALTIIAALLTITVLYVKATAARNDADWRSYVANLSAAESSLRFKEMAAAKRWLDLCPLALRGWEWFYLRIVEISGCAILTPERPLAGMSHKDVLYKPAGGCRSFGPQGGRAGPNLASERRGFGEGCSGRWRSTSG